MAFSEQSGRSRPLLAFHIRMVFGYNYRFGLGRYFVPWIRQKFMLQAGIVGLPNVGKSTLFNALTAEESALAANYPFATIEPNVGIVAVPDERLPILEKLNKAQKVIPERSNLSILPASSEARRRAKGSAISFLPTSARPTLLYRSSAVLRTKISSTSKARSTRPAISKRSRSNSLWLTWRQRKTSGQSTASDKGFGGQRCQARH